MLYPFISAKIDEQFLKQELLEIINGGILVNENFFLLKINYSLQSHMNFEDFEDKTSYECFINSIHIDDFVEHDHLSQGFLFLKRIFDMCNESYPSYKLVGILSLTDSGANVKIHTYRNGQNWINDYEIDNFEEPILIYHNFFSN